MSTLPFSIRRRLPSVCLSLFLFSAASRANAQTEAVLYNFAGQPDGSYPFATIIRGKGGNFYGTTTGGGAFNLGSVFVVSKRGAERVLHSFQGGTDGYYPNGALVQDKAGNLYGTTSYGGDSTAPACPNGCGTIFQVTPSGTENILYRFMGGSDGYKPQSALILDNKSNLYGVNYGGDFLYGTVFKLSPAGVLTTLYAFTGGLDGGSPYGSLIRDSKGNLYGTAQYEGALFGGTVFEVSKSGMETVLYSFAAGTDDGAFPQAGLVRDSQGNLYGTTLVGGGSTKCGQGCGTVFKVAPTGAETILYRFTGGADGGYPLSVLVLDKDGDLYGTNPASGSTQGTVFEITASGGYKLLYSFSGGADGANPIGGVIRNAKGILFGAAYQGAKDGFGAVFKLTP